MGMPSRSPRMSPASFADAAQLFANVLTRLAPAAPPLRPSPPGLMGRVSRSAACSDIHLSCSGTMGDVTTPPALIARIDLRGAELTAARLRAALPRGGADVETVLPKVRPIVQAVAERGAEAALEFGESFDGVRPPAVRVPDAALDAALAGLDGDVRDALQVMIERTRALPADHPPTDVTTTLGLGATVTERWVPVARVGLYVPGGNAAYPSRAEMNVLPAQAAGVE